MQRGTRMWKNDTTSPSASSSGKHPKYWGIRQRRSSQKWVSEIREPKSPNRIWLGTFPTPEMAAVAYDVAALAVKGKDAELNFPNSASSLPVPASSSPRDIQEAAASAAAAMDAFLGAHGHGGGGGGGGVTVDQPLIGGGGYVDEDMIFNMPNVLANMAEGMLLSPPRVDFLNDETDGNYSLDHYDLWN
ncbi:hypothetical protein LXL04_032573 [Taraxacum kok-saghyz]